jgi:hypothetical protein
MKILFFKKTIGYFFGAALLIASLLFSGCASSGHSGRGKLSDVIEKSSDNYSEERIIKSSEERRGQADYYDDFDVHTTATHRDSSGEPSDNIVSLSTGSGSFYENDFKNLYQATVSFGFCDIEQGHQFDFFLGFGSARIKPESELYSSIENGVTLFNAGISMKYFLTPPKTFMGIYLLGGVGYERMFWSYKNPVEIEGETQKLYSDDLEGIDLFIGAGVNLFQTETLLFGVEVVPNLTLWEVETYEGFENDMFKAMGSVKYKAVMTIKFK